MKQQTVRSYVKFFNQSWVFSYPNTFVCLHFPAPHFASHCPAWFSLVYTTYLIIKYIEMLIKNFVRKHLLQALSRIFTFKAAVLVQLALWIYSLLTTGCPVTDAPSRLTLIILVSSTLRLEPPRLRGEGDSLKQRVAPAFLICSKNCLRRLFVLPPFDSGWVIFLNASFFFTEMICVMG